MRRVEYSEILNHAAELAGRARTKLLAEERTMLRGYLTAYLRTLWTAEAWPETCVMEELEVVDRVISRREDRPMLGSYAGTFEIPAGVESGDVTFTLPRTPATVTATVSVPVDGDYLFATPLEGTLSKTGFSFTLNGLTPATGYVLNYEVTFV